MSQQIPFTVLQIVPDRLRGEALNIGIVLHTEAGPEIKFRMLPARLKALAPRYAKMNVDEWRDAWLVSLAQLRTADQRWAWLKTAMAPLHLSQTGGVICSEGADDLATQVAGLLERLVAPPAGPSFAFKKAPRRVGLNAELKTWFRNQHLYSTKVQDITNSRVVSSYPLSSAEELVAEFALKNGVIHVIETLDLRGHTSFTKGLRYETSHKALVLDLAQDELEATSERIAVVAADDYTVMRPAVAVLNRKASAVISMDSAGDRQWLADFVAKSLHVKTLLERIPELAHV